MKADIIASMDLIDKLAWIYIKDRKIFSTRSRGKDVWYTPGGKREEGESDTQALIREVKEELSVDLEPSTIIYYGTFEAQAHGKPKGVMVRMTCYTASYIGELKPSAEIERFTFLDSQTTEPLSPVDYLIFDDLKRKGILE